MNVSILAQRTYVDPGSQMRNPRDLEFALLANVTARLRAARQNTSPAAFAALAEALDLNRKVWQAFGTDIALPDNGLPQELRARLSYLAGFVALHTDRVLSERADVTVLIDINTAVMRGLNGGSPS